MRKFYEGYAETVGHDTVIEELIDAGANIVVARLRSRVSGEVSGIEGARSTNVVTGRKGKLVLIEFFWDHQEALEAARLRE